MTGIVALPDVEADLISHLRGAAAVVALTTNVGWEIKSPYPCLRLIQVGETTDEIMRVGSALIQLEAWGAADVASSTNRIALKRLLAVALAEIAQQFPGKVTATAVYSRVRVQNRAQWAPDDTTRQQRYFGRLIVAAHAV